MTRSVSAVAFAITFTVISSLDAQQLETRRPNLQTTRLVEWDIDGSGEWTISDGLLKLTKAGVPAGPMRRPAALAILKIDPFATAIVTAQIRSTAPTEVVNRDLEIIVGYQSPTRFYYIHLAGITDQNHNGIFLVADADRRRIDDGKSPPQLQDQNWHDVRVEWSGMSGAIDVYVDGAKTPSLHAVDTTIPTGRVGVGSFDDTGEFRNINVVGRKN